MVSTITYSNPILCPELLFLSRSILHDPEVFNDPMVFRPERYLKDGKLNPAVRDPDSAVFGFGRRSVDPTYSPICTLMDSSLVYVLEGI